MLLCQGYDLGDYSDDIDAESLITALKAQEAQPVIFRGSTAVQEIPIEGRENSEGSSVRSVGTEISPMELKSMLKYPRQWGPNEWGPIPFLPSNDILVDRLEKQWGELGRYR